MADSKEDDDDAITRSERRRAPTDKGLEEKLHNKINARRGKLRQLTAKSNEIEVLMENISNLNDVENKEFKFYKLLFEEFVECNASVLLYLKDEEHDADQDFWFQPKLLGCKKFMEKVQSWIEETKQCIQMSQICDNEVSPMDSVSMVSSKIITSNKSGSRATSVSKKSSISSASSARLKEEANRAALLAKAATLKERQNLEMKEAKLKAEMEKLEIETALAMSNAKIKVYQDCEEQQYTGQNVAIQAVDVHMPKPEHYEYDEYNLRSKQGQMSSLHEAVYSSVPASVRPKKTNTAKEWPTPVNETSCRNNDTSELQRVMQRQTDITAMLVKNQQMSCLPQRDVPLFHGDPLEFRSFMKAFEHAVDSRADSSADKLYFLEQYTRGEPRDLVKSCQHMPNDRGYAEAMRLLHEKFGNELKIATAIMQKAFKWPEIKSEDGKSLSAFSLFLVTCRNVMEDIEYMDELDNPTNMRIIISKLPYKLRERWRAHAYEYEERSRRRAKFIQLVEFVDRQAKVISNPLFGDLDALAGDKKHTNKSLQGTKLKREGKGSSSFATDFKQVGETQKDLTIKNNSAPVISAFTKPCAFCEKNHTLEQCYQFGAKPYKDKLDFLRKNGFCFGCLVKGHLSKDCNRRSTCQLCSKKHPSMLHLTTQNKIPEKEMVKVERTEVTTLPATISHETSACTGAGDNCVLAIVPVKLKSKKSDKCVEVYAFIDPGSSATFCTEALARRLNVQGRKIDMILSTMNSRKRVESYMLTDLEVSGVEENNFIELSKVFTQKSIPVSMENVPQQHEVDRWQYLSEVKLPHIDAEVEILIGNTEFKLLEPWRVINSKHNGPYAVKTALGWILNGPLREPVEDNMHGYAQTSVTVNRISLESVEQMLIQQYNHDFPERNCDDKAELSQMDHQFLNSVSNSVQLSDGHYCIDLPIKKTVVRMPNNRSAAIQRALNLKRKFQKNHSFHEEYTNFMDGMLSKGYAVKVPTSHLSRQDGQVWYIPHHGVYHPQKKKLRVVFDCAASFQGMSLNSELLQGPDMTNSLMGVLTRFRQESVAMMADIEAMYYQVRVSEKDSDMLRFLWWPNGDVSQNLDEYKMVVHLFGAKSSPSVANFALRKTAEENRSKSSVEAVNTVLNNFYVDDCLKSVCSHVQAIALYNDLTKLCASGGFRLTKWASNSRALLASVPEDERVEDVRDLDLSQDALPAERALGVLWCVNSDVFKFKINLKERPATRRGILSVTSSIYDPLGFLAPVTLPSKILMQQLCKEKLAWDDDIPEQCAEKWIAWLQGITQLADFSVPRCIKPVDFGVSTSAQLHHFSDASEVGYGVVSYLRLLNTDGLAHCAFMMGKSRVAPLKQTTIPRMELTAAVVAVNTDKMLKDELELELIDSVFWTDSTTVLRYIDNEGLRFKTFVANRIAIIRESTRPQQWRYVNTSMNPADCASRGLTCEKFMKNLSWIHGPSFLKEPENKWPETNHDLSTKLDDSEVKHLASVNLVCAVDSTDAVNNLINYYSDWYKLKRAVAWILRFKDMIIQRSTQKTSKDKKVQSCETKSTTKNCKALTMQDLTRAEHEIIKFTQSQGFKEEVSSLKKGNPSVKKNSCISKLDPLLQDGLLRVGGRLGRSAMPEHVKHPIIIPKYSHLTTLILRDIHERIGHCGRNYMLSKLRQKFWLPSANSIVRKFLSRCVTCRKIRAKAVEQKMSELPHDRITPDQPPFTNVGVDYFGPFEVKQGRSNVKRYGVLFTCLTTRAVHIEVAHTLDTDSCLNAIRRFVCRRGQVSIMRSDNGTNFIGAEIELRKAIQQWNQSKIESTLMQKGIQWIFNPPSGSHFGGVWERQIRSVRKILRSVLKEQTLNDECLHTFMCEVEAIINDRPLTITTDDPTDLEPLTPNHLLLMKRKPALPPGLFQKEDVYARRKWKQIQYLADLFWKRWVREYLPLLQERQKWTQVKKNLSVGDVVLIIDDSSPRNSWVFGRIMKVFPDRKGLIRRVLVKTKTNTLERPVDKLCLICEMDC